VWTALIKHYCKLATQVRKACKVHSLSVTKIPNENDEIDSKTLQIQTSQHFYTLWAIRCKQRILCWEKRRSASHITYRIVCQSIVSVNKWFLRGVKVRLRHSLTGHDVGIVHLPSVQLTLCDTRLVSEQLSVSIKTPFNVMHFVIQGLGHFYGHV